MGVRGQGLGVPPRVKHRTLDKCLNVSMSQCTSSCAQPVSRAVKLILQGGRRQVWGGVGRTTAGAESMTHGSYVPAAMAHASCRLDAHAGVWIPHRSTSHGCYLSSSHAFLLAFKHIHALAYGHTCMHGCVAPAGDAGKPSALLRRRILPAPSQLAGPYGSTPAKLAIQGARISQT
eukprot:356600-Chlamydomonas_euryale.AAC.2